MLDDLRYLEKEYGLDFTYSYQIDYRNFEIYRVLGKEVLNMLAYALLTVTLVVLFITFDVRMTLIVVTVVLLVVVYMTAICHHWGLTLNNFFAVNLTFALGIAVDYSVHIAHKYLTIKPPVSLITNKEKREYKISKAISVMGSGVFHGGFSTLLAVSVLGFANLFSFTVFFKTWSMMIIFGLLNGLIFQSVILSFFGPLDSTKNVNEAKIEASNDTKIAEK